MKVCLNFKFDGVYEHTSVSETVKIGEKIQNIPMLATAYRPITRDYRGYREGDKLRVIFLNEKDVEVHVDLWEKWGSLKYDDFRPIPKQCVFAKVEKVRP